MFYDRELACSGKYEQVSYVLILKSNRILKIDNTRIDWVCVKLFKL